MPSPSLPISLGHVYVSPSMFIDVVVISNQKSRWTLGDRTKADNYKVKRSQHFCYRLYINKLGDGEMNHMGIVVFPNIICLSPDSGCVTNKEGQNIVSSTFSWFIVKPKLEEYEHKERGPARIEFHYYDAFHKLANRNGQGSWLWNRTNIEIFWWQVDKVSRFARYVVLKFFLKKIWKCIINFLKS